jgi:hypothetical protein
MNNIKFPGKITRFRVEIWKEVEENVVLEGEDLGDILKENEIAWEPILIEKVGEGLEEENSLKVRQ